MQKYNLMKMLNIKLIGIVVVLMLVITVYDYYLSFQELSQVNKQYLISITEFLQEKKQPQQFSELANIANTNEKTRREETLLFNKAMQPVLKDVCMPISNIKFGFYSISCRNIVAVVPEDSALLWDKNGSLFQELYTGDTERFITEENSVLWYGASAITYIQPIKENNEIVGYAFAALNRDMIYEQLLQRTIQTILAAFIIMLFCIIAFHEMFAKLKQELCLFSESIVKEQACDYHSTVPELAPIFDHISEQTQRITRLDRLNLIGEMAAGLAHEIRNPMTTVCGFLQYFSKKDSFATYSEDFKLMIKELDNANRIITEFLSLSKEKAMHFLKEDVNYSIREVYPLLQAEANYRGCNITLDLCPAAEVMLDRISIHQLLLNMVKNSMEAMPQGGDIVISTRLSSAGVLLSINDQGGGISEAIREKIGTPFFTTKENGTGLGLAICYRIIQRHGATVELQSELCKGTTFVICFPQPSSENAGRAALKSDGSEG